MGLWDYILPVIATPLGFLTPKDVVNVPANEIVGPIREVQTMDTNNFLANDAGRQGIIEQLGALASGGLSLWGQFLDRYKAMQEIANDSNDAQKINPAPVNTPAAPTVNLNTASLAGLSSNWLVWIAVGLVALIIIFAIVKK